MSSDFCLSDAPIDQDLAIAEMDLSIDIDTEQSPAKVNHEIDPELCDGLDLISGDSLLQQAKPVNLNNNNSGRCPKCFQTQLIEQDALLVCNNCGFVL